MANTTQRKSAPQKTSPELAESLPPTTVVGAREKESMSAFSAPLSAEEIYRLIQEAAYFKAQARQFASGVELQDWLDAEKEVKQGLQVS